MEDKKSISFPPTNEGDSVMLHLEITRVSNGYIVKGWKEDGAEGLTVYNGADSHRVVAAYALNLALSEMKEGEIIDFNSSMTFTKKI